MTSPPSTRPRCTPALGIGIGVALGMIAIELVPTGRLVQFFSHPVLFRELEEIPLNTFRGVNLLRLTLVLAAMAWVIVPWLIGRMGRPDPLGTPPTWPRGGAAQAPLQEAVRKQRRIVA